MVLFFEKFLKIFSSKDSIFNKSARKQLLVCLIVNVIPFAHGVALGWTAPTLKLLTSDETPVSFNVSLTEASWIASLVGLGSIVGNLVLCNSIDTIGRKPCLFIMALPNICLWILIYSAASVEYLFIARFIAGLTGGSSISVIPLFINEIADARYRGAFQAFLTIAMNLGIFVGYIISSQLSYYLVPFIAVIFPVFYLITLSFFPETPHYLIMQEKDESALESLRFYKNYQNVSSTCKQEFNELKIAILDYKNGSTLSLKDFVTKSALKTYGIILVLFLINQFSGIYALITYMSDIFTKSSVPLEPNTCTIIIGFVQLLGNVATISFIDHYGRKILIIISSVGVIIGFSTFGCFTYFKESLDLARFNWIPLVLMIFIIFIGNIGINYVTIISAVEILPVKIRSKAFSCAVAVLSFFVFISLKTFPIFMETFGISITMWYCAAITAICLFFIVILLPETKGKSMDID